MLKSIMRSLGMIGSPQESDIVGDEYTISVKWDERGSFDFHDGAHHWYWKVHDENDRLIVTGYERTERRAHKIARRAIRNMVERNLLASRPPSTTKVRI